jgi:hypothetical protein
MNEHLDTPAPQFPSPISSMEIEEVRAEVPRRGGFLPSLIVVGIIAIIVFAVCTPRGRSQDVAFPERDTTGDANVSALVDRRLKMITILPRDRIPAILNPRIETAEAADGSIGLNEPTIGIEINGVTHGRTRRSS